MKKLKYILSLKTLRTSEMRIIKCMKCWTNINSKKIDARRDDTRTRKCNLRNRGNGGGWLSFKEEAEIGALTGQSPTHSSQISKAQNLEYPDTSEKENRILKVKLLVINYRKQLRFSYFPSESSWEIGTISILFQQKNEDLLSGKSLSEVVSIQN